jgi:CheY-like chemotaxis protein
MPEPCTALVADLNREVRGYVAAILARQFGCSRVFEAADGDQALAFLAAGTERFDWVFFDWELPGTTPQALMSAVRRHPGSRGAAVLAMTWHKERQVVDDALCVGVDEVLVKPFTLSLLLLKVRRASLADERRHSERYRSQAPSEVSVGFADGGELSGDLVNVSEGGVLAVMPLFFCHTGRIYQTARLALKTEEGPLDLMGELVRVEAMSGPGARRDRVLVALKLRSLSQQARVRLTRFIASLAPTPPGRDWEAPPAEAAVGG